ncbi:MAG: hypothetical protein JNK89_02730 [Saprospiraceae bacterium]|nr:hypothetical protein [Saprospiraceae bacterium]
MKNLPLSCFFPFSLVLVFACACTVQLHAQNPKISIQGTLKTASGASVSDGPQTVTFRLYNVATGGTHLWEEVATVDVVGGIYSHYLGSITALNAADFATTLWLGVRIGSYELTPRSELSYSPYAFSVYTTVCSGAVGDVKYSILNPTQFAQANGDCWVPMDGRALAATDQLRAQFGFTNVPDAGGLFMRAQEFSGSPDRDPSRTSASPIGTFQDQAVQTHGHNVSDPGHTHGYTDTRQNGNAGDKCGCAGQSAPASTATADDAKTTNSSGTGISIPSTGNGPETRPKNINLWAYIRIN